MTRNRPLLVANQFVTSIQGFDDDPVGEGGAFSVSSHVTLTVEHTIVSSSTAGQKVMRCILHWVSSLHVLLVVCYLWMKLSFLLNQIDHSYKQMA